ncbi:MAG: response regulator [Verrucomicrobia bacterium]|nr:response regulator [Verrucomicrobiota bacterium]
MADLLQIEQRSRAATLSKSFCLLLIALMLFCSSAVSAKDTDIEFLQRVWQAEDGLPNPSVRKILQSSDGYIWLGTDDGLLRFDGIRFTEFDRKDYRLRNDRWLVGVVEDQERNIWASGANGGLVRLQDGKSTQFTTNNGLLDNYVLTTHVDKSGTLWVGTRSGLTRYENGGFVDLSKEPGLIHEAIRTIYEDKEGTLWIGTAIGISRYKDKKFDSSFTEQLPEKSVMALLHSRDGSLWIGTPNGLTQIKDEKITHFTIDHGLAHNTIRALLEDSAGNFWVGTHGGLQRMVQGEFFSVKFRDSASMETGDSISDMVYDLVEDREGNVWVGTNVGLKRYRPQRFTIYSRNNGLSHDQVTCVYQDRAGIIWIGTFGGGLSRFENGTLTTFDTDTGLPSNHILSVFEDNEGTLWIGTDLSGLVRYQHGTFKTFRGKTAQANVIRIIHQDRSDNLWVVNNSGAEKFVNQQFEHIQGLNISGIRCMMEDHDGNLWFGSKTGLVRWDHVNTKKFGEADGLSSDWINSLYQDADGTIWIGSELGGLNRYKDGQFTNFGDKQQFRERIVHILEDADDRFWLGTKNGIFSIRKHELNENLDGKPTIVNVVSYGRVDGMKRAQCNGIGQPAGLESADGRIWFPTLFGVVSFSPSDVSGNSVHPSVKIEEVRANGNPVQRDAHVKLPPGNGDVEFHYTGLSFTVPKRVRFKYKLQGVDTDWQDAGTRRVARYTILRPGDYSFHVMASNNDGLWSETEASFSFSLAPHFYQAKSFYLLCAIGLATAGAGFYRLRLRNLKMREQDLLATVSDRTKELRQEIIERKQAEKRSTVLSRLGQRLSLVSSSEEAAQVIVEAADELIGWDACSLYSYDAAEDKGSHLLFFDVINGERQNLISTKRQMEMSPVARRTLQRGAQLILRKEPITANQDHHPFGDKSRPSASLMFVPICKGEKTVGILSIQSYKVNAYTPTDLDTLQALADYCGGTFEQIRAEAALKQSQQIVLRQERLAAVGQLSAGVAHEFNNILTIIKGHATLLLEDSNISGEAAQSVEQINNSTERAANLTRQMLAFSRKQVLQPRTIELNGITSEVAKMLGRLIGENISICCNLQPKLPLICADPGMIEQIIINLALNARDAMPKGGELIINTCSTQISDTHIRNRSEAYTGSFVCLTVADTGCGMDEEIQAKLFEPFFTTKEVGKGTGLGLSTVYGIVKQHQGWIEVTSKLGMGTAFNIFFPVDAKAKLGGPETISKSEIKRGLETILFVEDEPDIRQLARQVLEQWGYSVIEAASGVEALRIWSDRKADIQLLLTDMVMPGGVSGGELARRLEADKPGLKVIYMSGYSVEILEKDLREKKNFRFLEKPYTPQMMIQLVRECLDAKE